MICRQHTLQRRARASARFNRITTAKQLISFSTSQEKSWQVSLRGRSRFIALHVIIARNEPAHPNENPSWWNLILNCDQTEAHWRDCNQISRFGEHYCEVYTRIFFAHLKVLINSYAIYASIFYTIWLQLCRNARNQDNEEYLKYNVRVVVKLLPGFDNYAIVVQLFLIKRGYDTAVLAEYESLP